VRTLHSLKVDLGFGARKAHVTTELLTTELHLPLRAMALFSSVAVCGLGVPRKAPIYANSGFLAGCSEYRPVLLNRGQLWSLGNIWHCAETFLVSKTGVGGRVEG
jgi:hypothetical protein